MSSNGSKVAFAKKYGARSPNHFSFAALDVTALALQPIAYDSEELEQKVALVRHDRRR